MTAFGLWHRCLPYQIKRFSSIFEAWYWAAGHGYQLDGPISDALCARMEAVCE